jgi:hypothetical protein
MAASPANATTISFTAADIGGGVVEYTYRVSGHDFLSGAGFQIHFDASLFAALDPLSATASSGDWLAVVTAQPDPRLPGADGLFEAFASLDHPSLDGTFTVDATLQPGASGTGTQPFDILDTDEVSIIESDSTTPDAGGTPVPVPEPMTLGLLAGPLAMLMQLRVQRRRR